MTRPGWYWWAAMLASSLAVGVGAVLISLHMMAESDRKWCSIVTTMTDSYDSQPPVTPAGKQLAADLRTLRDRLGCPR